MEKKTKKKTEHIYIYISAYIYTHTHALREAFQSYFVFKLLFLL